MHIIPALCMTSHFYAYNTSFVFDIPILHATIVSRAFRLTLILTGNFPVIFLLHTMPALLALCLPFVYYTCITSILSAIPV